MNWEKRAKKKRKGNKPKTKRNLLKLKYIYKTLGSFGKASRKSFMSLPHSPQKWKAVVGDLAEAVGIKLDSERKLKNTETTKKHHKFTEFYFLKDIV